MDENLSVVFNRVRCLLKQGQPCSQGGSKNNSYLVLNAYYLLIDVLST